MERPTPALKGTSRMQGDTFNRERLAEVASEYLLLIRSAPTVEVARERLYRAINTNQFDTYAEEAELPEGKVVRVRDCTRALRSMIKSRSDRLASFSVLQALYDIARGKVREDLKPGFYADLTYLFLGIKGEGPGLAPGDYFVEEGLRGREAARRHSTELDRLWANVGKWISRYPHGLAQEVIARREARRRTVVERMGATASQWSDWRWQLRCAVGTLEELSQFVSLSGREREALRLAEQTAVPFRVTPYYLTLIDEEPTGADRAVRAQVIPPRSYIEAVVARRRRGQRALDFMLEGDTSPVDLITRRYPAICILKPYNSCPQICVYCQRNWEADNTLGPEALAPWDKIEAAVEWISRHPAISEVLITGGDPLVLDDATLRKILHMVCAVPTVQRVRIGTRTPVTMPMRISQELVDLLAHFREPLRREIAVVTHVQHPYEVTPELFAAVERLRSAKINVYNQNVFTFFVSRRFEAASLRQLLKRVGIEPYYTFNTKGKEETEAYRVPIARLLQEQKEEARLLPGLSRLDEAVYNVPAMGKNYLRGMQHREVISILPDGSRVYEFHPWVKNIRGQPSYVGTDVPILSYLRRLEEIGEDPSDYQTVWYYF